LQGGWYWDASHNCLKGLQQSVLYEKVLLRYLRKQYNIQPLHGNSILL
jgi:hypothetical protein